MMSNAIVVALHTMQGSHYFMQGEVIKKQNHLYVHINQQAQVEDVHFPQLEGLLVLYEQNRSLREKRVKNAGNVLKVI